MFGRFLRITRRFYSPVNASKLKLTHRVHFRIRPPVIRAEDWIQNDKTVEPFPPVCRPTVHPRLHPSSAETLRIRNWFFRVGEPPTTTATSSSAVSSSHAVIDSEVLRTFTCCGCWPRCAAGPRRGSRDRNPGRRGKERWSMKKLNLVKIWKSADDKALNHFTLPQLHVHTFFPAPHIPGHCAIYPGDVTRPVVGMPPLPKYWENNAKVL